MKLPYPIQCLVWIQTHTQQTYLTLLVFPSRASKVGLILACLSQIPACSTAAEALSLAVAQNRGVAAALLHLLARSLLIWYRASLLATITTASLNLSPFIQLGVFHRCADAPSRCLLFFGQRASAHRLPVEVLARGLWQAAGRLSSHPRLGSTTRPCTAPSPPIPWPLARHHAKEVASHGQTMENAADGTALVVHDKVVTPGSLRLCFFVPKKLCQTEFFYFATRKANWAPVGRHVNKTTMRQPEAATILRNWSHYRSYIWDAKLGFTYLCKILKKYDLPILSTVLFVVFLIYCAQACYILEPSNAWTTMLYV